MYASPSLHDRQTRTDLATNFLQNSDKLVYGPLVLLAPEWTVVKRGLCRWSRHWAPRHASTRASRRWIAPGGRFQRSLRSGNRRRGWARNLWEGCYWPKGQTPELAECTGMSLRWSPHGRGKGRSQGSGRRRDTRNTRKRARWRKRREQRITQAHDTWMGWHLPTLEPWANVVSHIVKSGAVKAKKWRVRCTVYRPVGCSRLLSAVNEATATNNWKMIFFSWTPPAFVPIPPWRTWTRRVPPLILLKRNRFCTFFSCFSVEAVHECDCGSEVWSKSHRCILARFV